MRLDEMGVRGPWMAFMRPEPGGNSVYCVREPEHDPSRQVCDVLVAFMMAARGTVSERHSFSSMSASDSFVSAEVKRVIRDGFVSFEHGHDARHAMARLPSEAEIRARGRVIDHRTVARPWTAPDRYPGWRRKFFRSVPPDRVNVQAFGPADGPIPGDRFMGEHQIVGVGWGPYTTLGAAIRFVRGIVEEVSPMWCAEASSDAMVAWLSINPVHDLDGGWTFGVGTVRTWMALATEAHRSGETDGIDPNVVKVATDARLGVLVEYPSSVVRAPGPPPAARPPGARRIVAKRPPDAGPGT